MGIEVAPLSGALGAEIKGIDLARPLGAETVRDIRHAWLDHLVVVFRDQDIDQHRQLAFTRYFGTPGGVRSPRPQRGLDGRPLEPGIMIVSNIRRGGAPLGLPHDGEMWFHSDMCYDERPHQATLLYGIEIPSVGGDTLFANMYSAYARLSERARDRIRGRTALQMHEYRRTDRPSQRVDLAAVPHFSHPIVIAHAETGRPALYVNRLMTARIDGLDAAEGGALLDELLRASEDPEIVYRHVWRPGDLVMWDNRCVAHARTDFPDGERRLLRRTTTEGERPSAWLGPGGRAPEVGVRAERRA